MRVVEKEAKLGGAKLRHEKEGEVSRDEALSKADKAGFWAMDEDVGRGKARTAMRARGVVTCAGSEAIGIVRMKSVTHD